MKILVVSDIHCRHEQVENSIDKFLAEKYDKIIMLGDYADSWDRSNEDMYKCFRIIEAFRESYNDQLVTLRGNHCQKYLSDDPTYSCSGFRKEAYTPVRAIIKHLEHHYRFAYGIGNYLFTHAGISLTWWTKHYKTIAYWALKMELDINNPNNIWEIIEGISKTHDGDILLEVGASRGGYRSNHGGPLWCDKSEIMISGPLPGFNQYVGHTEVPFISKHTTFGKSMGSLNTSITFTDVLWKKEQFLTLDIKDK